MPIVPGDAKDQEGNDLTDSATQGEREGAPNEWPTTIACVTPKGHQRLLNKIGLGARRPESQARALAVTETWAVERNNPIALFSLSADTAQLPVFECHRVAMDQNDRRTAPSTVRIVETDAVDGQETAGGRVLLLCPAR